VLSWKHDTQSAERGRLVSDNVLSPPPAQQGRKSLQDIEREEVEAALRRHGWVQVRAARELGLTQRQMGYRIKKYGLSRLDSYR
jgi:Nif-specific regulatory protein